MTNLRHALAALLVALLAPAFARAQAHLLLGRTDASGPVQRPAQSASTDEGAAALATNPAGLALGHTGFTYVHEDGSSSLPNARRGDGLYLGLGGLTSGAGSALSLGLSVEWLRPRADCSPAAPCVRRMSLGLSGGTPAWSVGLALRKTASDENPGLDGVGVLDLGLTLRPWRWVSLAGVAANVNAPRDVPRLGTLSLGLRPFTDRVTLAADYLFDERDGFSRGRFGYLASVQFAGFELAGGLAHPVNPRSGQTDVIGTLAIRAGFGHASFAAGGGAFFDGPSGGTGALQLDVTAARGPAILGGVGTAQVLDVAAAIEGPSTLERLLGAGGGLDAYDRLVLRLERAQADETLRTLVLELRDLDGLSLGRIEELRSLVLALRASGKHVLAWMEGGGDAEYYLSTAAERIYAAPQSMLTVNGFAATRYYLRGVLDKLGIVPEFVKAGEYKSAPEQFTNTEASEPAAAETNALLDDQYARYLDAVSKARGIPRETVVELLSRGVMIAEQAAQDRLVDGTATRGRGLDEAIAQLSGERLVQERMGDDARVATRWGSVPAIALVVIEGDIMPAKVSGTGVERIVRQLRRAADDADVRAIVVRVESPGGDVGASEQLWHAVREAGRRKPVVASFGDVAASGGYYVGCAAGTIVAEPSTVTGSIGVFAGKADLSPLLSRIGVTTQVFRRGDSADILTLTRPWSERERAVLEASVQRFYETFLQRVAEGRNMAVSDVDKVARGRVWTGAQARERGLVDVLGGLDEALRIAARKAGLGPGEAVRVVGAPGLFETSLAGGAERSGAMSPTRALTLLAGRWLAGGGATEPVAAAWLAAQAAPLVEALSSGRPMALAVDLPLAR